MTSKSNRSLFLLGMMNILGDGVVAADHGQSCSDICIALLTER
jgi:hypothetical protein